MSFLDFGVNFDFKLKGKHLDIAPVRLEKALELLNEKFGFQNFLPGQKEVLSHVLDGEDCIAMLPTGAGKSLCYIIPALMHEGMTLVVSPLIALIRDQIQKLRANNIPAAALDSLQGDEDKDYIWEKILANEVKILFCSPERLSNSFFREKLQRTQRISLVAVDEAHCISQWGTHFRPEYSQLGIYLKDFANVQKIALTATATKKVCEDIQKTLHMVDAKIVQSTPIRENLNIKTIHSKTKANHLALILQAVLNETGSGIIYAPTRAKVEAVYTILQNAGVAVGKYHGGLLSEERHSANANFFADRVRIMVATNAFGLGIDKPNIRFVFHAGMPGSIEQYMQEIGRAGRDGAAANCILFFVKSDYHIQKYILEKSAPDPANADLEKLNSIYDYCTKGANSEDFIREYFR